jgi:hypothetical protein
MKPDVRWLFVGGPHRSGTTFLVDLLNSHPNIGIFNEFPMADLVSIPELYFRFQEEIEPVRAAREGAAAANGGASGPALAEAEPTAVGIPATEAVCGACADTSGLGGDLPEEKTK